MLLSHPALCCATVVNTPPVSNPKPDKFFGNLVKNAEPVTYKLSDFAPYTSAPLLAHDEPLFAFNVDTWMGQKTPHTECTITSTWFRLMQRVRIGANDNGPLTTVTVVRPVTFKAEEKLSSAPWLKRGQNSSAMPACFSRGVETSHKTYAFDYPTCERAETQAKRKDRYTWEVAKRKAQPTVCEMGEAHPIKSVMDTLEEKQLLRGEHDGVEWEMSPARTRQVAAMQSRSALRYAKAHRRWITEKMMQRKGLISEFRSLPEIVGESRTYPQ
jgi:hypothetical protein